MGLGQDKRNARQKEHGADLLLVGGNECGKFGLVRAAGRFDLVMGEKVFDLLDGPLHWIRHCAKTLNGASHETMKAYSPNGKEHQRSPQRLLLTVKISEETEATTQKWLPSFFTAKVGGATTRAAPLGRVFSRSERNRRAGGGGGIEVIFFL